jgi:regulator of RNase E activity RraA/CMP-N-acetylneuraminic acid synthetase
MKIAAFVPAKGTSSRIANKNTQIFNGEPLFMFTVRKLLRCGIINEVYIDSECPAILALGERAGAIPLKRDPSLASNQTDGHELFFNEARQVQADIYVQHLCTSPFIKESTIEKSIRLLIESDQYDSVVLGKKEKVYEWNQGAPAYGRERIPNSVDLPDRLSEAMGLYVVKSTSILQTGKRIGNKPKLLFGEPLELIDVNTHKDLELAWIIASGILASEEKKLKVLGRFISSSILSDICDELGLNCILPPQYNPNISGIKIFGRARTLHIRNAAESDPPDSIYKALQSYKQVVSNDIIVVKNDQPSLAYFGELNMSLAIRSGAVGAVIQGVTRDNAGTRAAGFPVFSKGRYCKDIKGRGAVASINETIEVDGITINPNDLVFGDEDGIVVVPRRFELDILRRAIKVMRSENSIISDVCNDVEVEDLVEKYGFF